jgi:predicted nucleic-acid-binding protein
VIGVDTNVLVRYVVEDDPAQSAAAVAMIERAVEKNRGLFISQIVLCELVWVLSYAYKFTREEITSVLHQLRRGAQIAVEGSDEVRRAIDAYTNGRGDFADYLIAERSIANGCSAVATFDRVLHSDPRFTPPDRVR